MSHLRFKVAAFSICTSTPDPLSVQEPAFMAAGPLEDRASASRLYVTVRFPTSPLALAHGEKGLVGPVPKLMVAAHLLYLTVGVLVGL
jgi:hypothetical protein